MIIKKRKYNFNIKNEINLVPLLDILLVLFLSTIIATARNDTSDLTKLDIPKFDSNKSINDDSVIIEMLNNNKFNIIINSKRCINNISYNQLMSKINFYVYNYKNATFLIGSNENIYYREILDLINLLYKNGIKSVGLVTKKY